GRFGARRGCAGRRQETGRQRDNNDQSKRACVLHDAHFQVKLMVGANRVLSQVFTVPASTTNRSRSPACTVASNSASGACASITDCQACPEGQTRVVPRYAATCTPSSGVHDDGGSMSRTRAFTCTLPWAGAVQVRLMTAPSVVGGSSFAGVIAEPSKG